MTDGRRMLCGCLIGLAMLTGGCNDFLAARMVAPPNGLSAGAGATGKPASDEQRMTIKSPAVQLSYWVLEPKLPAKGTILVLHGFLADHHQLNGAAKSLQSAGYRAVLVDLPGHGKSTADHLTFGVDDAAVLKQLADLLQDKKLCGPTLGVLGTSYGAACAIQYAAADPRVKAVVAVAPFADLREEAPYFGRHLLPLPGLLMKPQDFEAVVIAMGRDAHFDPDAANPLKAITRTNAQILLLHGTADMIVPSKASEELAAAGAGHAKLILMPGVGHLELCLDWFGQLRGQSTTWFDTYLAAAPERSIAGN